MRSRKKVGGGDAPGSRPPGDLPAPPPVAARRHGPRLHLPGAVRRQLLPPKPPEFELRNYASLAPSHGGLGEMRFELRAKMGVEEPVGRAQEAAVLLDQVPDSQRDVRFHVRPPSATTQDPTPGSVFRLDQKAGASRAIPPLRALVCPQLLALRRSFELLAAHTALDDVSRPTLRPGWSHTWTETTGK